METTNLKTALVEVGLSKAQIETALKSIEAITVDALPFDLLNELILENQELKGFKKQIAELSGPSPVMKPMKKATPKPKAPAAKKPGGNGLGKLLESIKEEDEKEEPKQKATKKIAELKPSPDNANDDLAKIDL